MKIAIISDIHNNIPNLKKVLDYCVSNKIEKIICCGDLASLETLDFLNDNYKGEIFYTFGNMDNDQLKHVNILAFKHSSSLDYKHTKIFKDFGETHFEVGPRTDRGPTSFYIAFVHKPEEAKKLCELGKYNFVFYGHTHKPFEEIINDCKMLNPGNVANQFYPPTFAVWNINDNKFELVRINELK